MSRPHTNRPEIDGLRAIAIFVVVLYHLGQLSKGGFIGVDVFFVISGYLITSIILNDLETGTFSLANFYERRIRRIFPALFACLAVSTVGAYLFLFPAEFVFFAKSVIAATFFAANHFFLETSGYFQRSAEEMPLIHTWSLAVEEQFYLLFPLALLPLVRRGSRAVNVVLALTALSSLCYSEILVRTDPNSAFYLLASRAWELLLGSLLAVGAFPDIKTQRGREILSSIGLLAILIPAFAFNKNTHFPGLWALVPCLGAAALIHTGREQDTFASRLLSTRPFVFLGLISYSLYLWHVPIIAFYRLEVIKRTPYATKAMLFVLCVAIAYLSWKFIEQPFRKKKLARERRHIFALGGTAAAIVAAVAAGVLYGDGLKERFSPEVQQLAAFKYVPEGPMRDGTCFISRAASKTSDFDQKRCLAVSADKKNVLIIGDSHAAHLWSGLSTTYPDVNFLQATASGCARNISNGGSVRCRKVMNIVFNYFLPAKRLDAIVLALNWSGDEVPEIMGAIEKLKSYAGEVYVFGPIVQYSSPLPRLLTRGALLKDPGLVVRARKKKSFQVDVAFKEFFDGKGVRYVSLIDALCEQNECVTIDEQGQPLQHDGGHLTAGGSALLARRLSDRLAFAR